MRCKELFTKELRVTANINLKKSSKNKRKHRDMNRQNRHSLNLLINYSLIPKLIPTGNDAFERPLVVKVDVSKFEKIIVTVSAPAKALIA